jgi:hypothetical protein
MPLPIVMTPRIVPSRPPGNRSAVFAVMAGPLAPQVRPKKQACSHSSHCWSGLVISSAQTTPMMGGALARH